MKFASEAKMNEEFSCIKQVVKTVQLPLPLSFISNEVAGISEILDSWKRQYVKSVHGVVVDYKNVSLTSRRGYIGINKPLVFYSVKATFDLFCPKVGDIVKGKINRISKEHIGCLIQGTINATIPLSKDSSAKLSQFVDLNRDILFEIVSFDYERKMIRVKGEITHKCRKLMKRLFPPVTIMANSTSVTSTHVKYNFDEEIGTSREDSYNSSSELFSESSPTVNNIKESDVSSNVLSNNSENLLNSTKKKKSSKIKRESSFVSDCSTADETPKKKHKKKNISHSEIKLEIADKSLSNQSIDIHQNGSLTENLVLHSGKKEIFLPIREIQEGSPGKKSKKRKQESSSPGSESKKIKKEVNDSVIDSLDNLNLIDEISSWLQIASPAQENELKHLEKKKHSKKSDAGKLKTLPKKSKLKKKKNKLLASGDIPKKDKSDKSSKKKKLNDKKSKKHQENKSHKKVKSKKEKKKKTPKSKKISNIKSETN